MIITINKALLLVGAIFVILLIYLLFVLTLVLILDKKFFNKRLYKHRIIKSPEYSDFTNLVKDPFEFDSNGITLRGFIYYKTKKSNKIVIFSPGFTAINEMYLSEIDLLTNLGYTVYIYDYTGSYKSDGKKFKGAPQVIIDLNNCIEYLKNNIENCSITLFGHSMGAYASVNVLNYQKVDKVIAVAPCNNIIDVIKDLMYEKVGRRILFLLTIYKILLYIRFKKYSSLSTYKTLKYVNTKVLIVQGTDDKVVFPNCFYQFAAVNDNMFVETLLVEDREHYPLLSKDAVSYRLFLDHYVDELQIKYGKNIPETEVELLNNKVDQNLRNKLDEGIIKVLEKKLKEV